MCGFAGIVDFSEREINAAVLNQMAQTVAHRGPDERGLLIDGKCGLAHRRLSIVDLSASQQPMTMRDCDVSLAYNGELYNYVELRKELAARGTRCITQGDTEVILRWVNQDWINSLDRFNGMFAFAAWDRKAQRLLLARDPLGEKPLFYANPSSSVMVFGSEVKAVLAHPEVDGELDLDALRQSLRFRTCYGARSLYRHVRQVPPGSYIQFDRNGLTTGTFFDLIDHVLRMRQVIGAMSEREQIDYGNNLLSAAISERLMADVPLGVFLSGGIDSSLIAATMRQLIGGQTLRTFSVGFTDDPRSELTHARAVADAVGAHHTELEVGPREFSERLEALRYRDGPVSEPADIAVAALSRVAKQYVKVVLSGEGADEAFGGYPKYLLARVPSPMLKIFQLLGPEWARGMASCLRIDPRRARIGARALSLPSERDRLAQWFSYFDRAELTALLPGLSWTADQWEATVAEQDDALRRAAPLTPIGRMQAVDCLTWLPGNMLDRGDRMSMSEGLELRPPFLDTRLVAFGLALPDRMKTRGRCTKWIVRQWGVNKLPKRILSRSKWGFKVPLAQWFRADLREMLFDRLSRRGGLCATFGDRNAVQKLLNAHDSGAVDADLTLWSLLAAEVWYQSVTATDKGALVSSSSSPIAVLSR